MPEVAMICVVPSATPVTTPLALTVATDEDPEDHVRAPVLIDAPF
jgi:hypothetical protein